jgi:hypothetical protein
MQGIVESKAFIFLPYSSNSRNIKFIIDGLGDYSSTYNEDHTESSRLMFLVYQRAQNERVPEGKRLSISGHVGLN